MRWRLGRGGIEGTWRTLGWVPRFQRLYHSTFQFLPPVFTLHQGLSPWLPIIPIPTPFLTLTLFLTHQLPSLPCSSSQVSLPLSFSCSVCFPLNNGRKCMKRGSLFSTKTKMLVNLRLFLFVCLFISLLLWKCLIMLRIDWELSYYPSFQFSVPLWLANVIVFLLPD